VQEKRMFLSTLQTIQLTDVTDALR